MRRDARRSPDGSRASIAGREWTRLESPPPPTNRSGLTSSDDCPRYRRGSKRRPPPPKTPPGLVQPTHPHLAVAHFEGRGRGYAAVGEIPASAMLLQERPREITGAYGSAQEARRAMARVILRDPRYEHLCAGDKTRGAGEREKSPVDGVSDEEWNLALARVACNGFVRQTKGGAESRDGAADASKDGSARDGGMAENDGAENAAAAGDVYSVRILAHVSVCNHSCRPNAAVSVSDNLVTLYSLRVIKPGEEVTVCYGTSLLWLPLWARRTHLARVWGFVCKCSRCQADLEAAVAEQERGLGVRARQANRHGMRPIGGFTMKGDEEKEGIHEWEYGETGYEAQFDEEGRLRGASSGGGGTDGSRGGGSSAGGGGSRGGIASSDSDDTSSDDSSSSSDSWDSSDSSIGGGALGGRRGGWGRGGRLSFNNAKKLKQKMKPMGPGRLYNKLVKDGIGADHWQMHATREVLVSRLLSKEGRKDFDLDLLLEHASCASRLAPNHPHFIRLVTLVEEVFKSNREVIAEEQFWLWTIELLREAIHPDVLFWNTEFKGFNFDRER